MLRQVLRNYYWMLRVAVPLTLAVMLAVPVLLTPDPEAMTAVEAHAPGATFVPVGAGEGQYTFLRLPAPAFLTVQFAPGAAPSVTESRGGMLLWVAFLALLAVLTWWLWRPRRTPPNNSFKGKR